MKKLFIIILFFLVHFNMNGQSLHQQDSLGRALVFDSTYNAVGLIHKWTVGTRYIDLWNYVDNVYDSLLLSSTGVTGSRLADSTDSVRTWVIRNYQPILGFDSSIFCTKGYRQKGIDSVTSIGYITGNQNISLSGDVSGSGTISIATTLTTVNPDVGTYSYPSNVTVDAKGRITAIYAGSAPINYSFTSPLSVTSGTVSMTQSNTSTNGWLNSTDWNTFNNKGSGTLTGVTINSFSPVFTWSVTGTSANPIYTPLPISQSQNLFFASPNGSSGNPSFRAIVAADVPTLNQNTTGTAANVTGTVSVLNGGTGSTVTTSVNGTPINYGTNNTLSVGTGTVTNVIGGTNISVTGTSTVQPTVNISGTIAVANGGTGTTSQTTINTTPIVLGTTNVIPASANTLTTTTLNPTVINSSLQTVGTLSSGSIPYSLLTGTPTIQTTINGTTIANNTSNTITASANTLTTTTLNATVANASITNFLQTIIGGTWSATIGSAATGSTQAAGNNSTSIATTAYCDAIQNDVIATTTYTVTASDIRRVKAFTSNSAITLTIPTGLGAGFNCTIQQLGTGTITPGGSATLVFNPGLTGTSGGQNTEFSIMQYGNTTDKYLLQGYMK